MSTPPTLPIDADEYSDFDFADFTDDDLAAVQAHADAVYARDAAAAASKPPPVHITIQYDSPAEQGASDSLPERVELSPYERFRPFNTLSVSDLVGPAWCELQFDYGLRQDRSKKLQHRPPSFTSRSGKEIVVKQQVAAQNDVITKKGKAVHKKLEEEIPVQQVKIDVETKEDRWGLRILNMLWSLNCLLDLGFTREMPVFGFIHGHVIIGIIDEINRTPLITSPSNPKDPRFQLSLLDAKTRRSDSLPSYQNSLPARLQLMLYHTLLADLTSWDHPFPFPKIWETLQLVPSQPFSRRFRAQLRDLEDKYADVTCLDDLALAWSRAIKEFGHSTVNDTLKVVYRRQKSHFNSNTSPPVVLINDMLAEDPELAWALQLSLCEQSDKDSDIIGTTEFDFDSRLLNNHLTHVLQWWHGERDPVGVDVANSARCNSCEYRDGCEWREQKSLEAQAKIRARKERID